METKKPFAKRRFPVTLEGDTITCYALFAEPLFAASIVAAAALRGAGDVLIPAFFMDACKAASVPAVYAMDCAFACKDETTLSAIVGGKVCVCASIIIFDSFFFHF